MKFSAVKLLNLIRTHQLRIFKTRDILTLTGMTAQATTHALDRLEIQSMLERIKRGVWVNQTAPDLNPFEAVPYLTSPWPSYVSLHSALADYGLIDEIPQVIYAVTSFLPKKYSTAIGDFHIHHLPEHLIWGYEFRKIGQGSYPVAEPEKAFLDLAYLALVPRSPIRMALTRDRKWELNPAKLRKYALRFKYLPLIRYLRRNKQL